MTGHTLPHETIKKRPNSVYKTTAFQDFGNRQSISGVPDGLYTNKVSPAVASAYCHEDFSGFGTEKGD